MLPGRPALHFPDGLLMHSWGAATTRRRRRQLWSDGRSCSASGLLQQHLLASLPGRMWLWSVSDLFAPLDLDKLPLENKRRHRFQTCSFVIDCAAARVWEHQDGFLFPLQTRMEGVRELLCLVSAEECPSTKAQKLHLQQKILTWVWMSLKSDVMV